jgi:hypothetical protein
MSNLEPKTVSHLVQMELPWSILPSQEYRAGSFRRHESVCEALKSALSKCGLGRDTVAAELTRLSGDKISVNHLNNWCAESKNGWRLPLEYVAALCIITGDSGIIKAALESSGLIVLDKKAKDYYELGKITAENRLKTREKNQIFGRLGI